MTKPKEPKHQDVEGLLIRSEYFWRYTLRDWVRRNPDAAKGLIRIIRADPESEADVQYHLERVAKG